MFKPLFKFAALQEAKDLDIETFVIATHGIVKKTQKTPKKEIEKAESIRKEYFNDKNN